MRRLVQSAALAATLLTPLGAPHAQSIPAPAGHRTPRRLTLLVAGALTGALAGASYIFTKGQSEPGSCGTPRCVGIVTIGTGALIGYSIGREFDQLYNLRYHNGAPLNPPSVSVSLPGEPVALAASDSTVLVGGSAGVQIFRSGPDLTASGSRAGGVRGIVDLAVTPGGSLALGSASGLYLYPPATGPGALLREGTVNATAASADRVFIGTGTGVESAPIASDTAGVWPGVDLGGAVRDLEYDGTRQILWAVTDSLLVALRPAGDSLTRLGALTLDVTARRLTVQGNRGAIAAGERGVVLVDLADPAAPKAVTSWTGARFAYDVSLAGPRLYVAAGPEGMYLVDVSTDAAMTVGLARELGFAAALISRGGYTYIIDRGISSSLRRIATDFKE